MNRRLNLIFILCSLLILASSLYTSAEEFSIVQLDPVTEKDDSFIINTYDPHSDFQISYQNEFSICSCDAADTQINIKNSGNIAEHIIIASDNRYSSVYPNSFYLMPGESKKVNHIVNLPCDAKENQHITLDIVSNTNIKKQVIQNAVVKNCPNLLVVPIKTNANATPCTSAEFSFAIYNPGKSSETYDLTIDNFIGRAEIPAFVALSGRRNATVKFRLEPDCSVFGTLEPTVIITSRGSLLKANLPIRLVIDRKYDFSVAVPEEIDACIAKQVNFPVTVKNLAGFSNEFTLTVDSDKSGIMPKNEFDSFTLGSGEEKIFSIAVKPVDRESNILVSVKSDYGDLLVENDIRISAEECYKFDYYLTLEDMCVDESKSGALGLYVRNNGKYDSKYVFEKISGPDYMYVAESEVIVRPGEERTVPIVFSQEKPGQYYIKWRAKVDGTDIEKYTELTLNILPWYNCYKPEFDRYNIDIRHGDNEKTILIKNNGIKPSDYDITVDEKAAGWIRLSDDSFKLEPGEEFELDLDINASEDMKLGWHPVIFTLSEKESGQTYGYKVTFALFDHTFGEYLVKYRCLISLAIVGILIILVLMFVLAASNAKKNIFPGLIALIILLLISMFILFSCFQFYKSFFGWNYQEYVNETENECQTFFSEDFCLTSLYQSFKEDHIHYITLSDFFSDPDEDRLMYSASETKNMDIKIFEDKARVSPKKDWYGIEAVTFSADDSRGGTVNSSAFYLHVLNLKEFNLIDFVLDNYGYIIFVLAIVLIITAVVLCKKNKNIRESQSKSRKKK
ncbi:MAG: hypothetical protein KKF44_01440 [Nanoarchaeota archaeon]|nr:hypothetical protein [Nanoarchaeota archaeon]